MGFSLKWRSAKSPMFPLEPVALAEALSGGLGECLHHQWATSTSSCWHWKLEGWHQEDYRTLLSTFPRSWSRSQLLFRMFELEQRAHPVLPLSVTISHLEQINQGEPSHVNTPNHFWAWVYLKEGCICSTGWQVNLAADEEDFQPSKLL